MEGIFKQDKEQSIKTEFSDLPNCILFNILRRLPLKSIFICKCVSKQWCSFISDPSFGRLYAITRAGDDSVSSHQQWNLLFRFLLETRILSPEIAFDRIAFDRSDSNFASKGFSLDFLATKKTSPAKILAASSGLLLCSDAQFWQKRYFVCNPLTCQWTSLPPPILSVQWTAAGLVANDDSFLVVRISKISEDPDLLCVIKIETFCSKTGMWQLSTIENKSAVVFDYRLCIKTDTPVVEHNKILHWLESHHKIITFCPEMNQIGSIKLPRKNQGRKLRQLSLIGLTEGQLGYLEVTDSCVEPRDLRLWLLRDYEHGAWTLEHEIRIGECRMNEGPITEVTREKLFVFPLALDPFDAQVVYLMMGGWLFSCNVKTGRLWVVRRRICSNQVLPFVIPPWPATVPHLDRNGC